MSLDLNSEIMQTFLRAYALKWVNIVEMPAKMPVLVLFTFSG